MCIAIAHPVELYPLINLLMQRLSGCAVGRMECGIVAIGAASPSDSTVPVRAGETGIYDHLL